MMSLQVSLVFLHLYVFNQWLFPPAIRDLGSGTKVYPPQLVQFDQWGRRVDQLHTSEGWRSLKAVAQKEGIPGVFYERKHQEYSRIHGFAKVILMAGDSHEVSVAMVISP
jgi:hypothetical protein